MWLIGKQNRRKSTGRKRRRNKRRVAIRQRLEGWEQKLAPHLSGAWRLWPLVMVALLVVLAWSHFMQADRYRVRSIDLPVCQHLTRAALLEYLHARPGQNIFTVDLNQAAQRLYKHPWIGAAVVRRELPDNLVVELTEREAVALLKLDKLYLVDSDGEPFKDVEDGDPIDLPLITGFDPGGFVPETLEGKRNAALLTEAVGILACCEKVGRLPQEQISEIRYDRINGFSVTTVERGMRLHLGIGQYPQKLKRYAVVAQRLQQRLDQVRQMDLALSGRVIVRGLEKGPGA